MSEKLSSVGGKLLSGSVLQVVILTVTAITSFFLMPFIVHHLGDRIYGFWSLAAAFIGYYSLLDLGLSGAVSQYISIAIGRNDQEECRAIFNTALRIQLMLGGFALLLTAIIIVATPWFCHNTADAHLFRNVIAILGINAALSFPQRVYGGVLYTEFRFDILSWISFLWLALRTGFSVCAILAGGGLLSLAWVTFLASLPIAGLQIWFARREALWARIEMGPVRIKTAKSLSSYSVYSFLAYLADILRFQVDPLVISSLIGLAAVTHYRVAGMFAQYYLQILMFSVGMLQPVLSRLHGSGDRAGLEKVFFFGTKISTSLSVFICLALIGWGKPFITLWMGQKYEDGYLPLVLLSLAVLLDVFQKPSADLLFATFKQRSYAYMNVSEGVLNLVFSVALAWRFGIVGVAMGTLIGAFVIRAAVQPWWVCRSSGFHYADYMRFLGKNLLCCGCLMGAATAIVVWGLRPSYPFLVSSAICATAIYSIGTWVFMLNPSEREHFKKALRRNLDQKQAEPVSVIASVS